jgi:hypothetical protein
VPGFFFGATAMVFWIGLGIGMLIGVPIGGLLLAMIAEALTFLSERWKQNELH